MLESNNLSKYFMLFLFTFLFFCSCADSRTTVDSLDEFTGELALRTLAEHRPHTGALYRVVLPANLSGMEVSVVGLRSRRLWDNGAENPTSFHIPSRTKPVPHVKRLALVYQDLGNMSSRYYTLPSGYSFLTRVVGFLVYDATNTSSKSNRRISLNTMGKPILIRFPNLTLEEGLIHKSKCASFASDGTILISKMRSPGVCNTTDQGHFSIVVQSKKKPILPYWLVIAVVLGLAAIVLGGFVGVLSMRRRKIKKIQEMEEKADDDLVLENRFVRGSKMPSGGVTRTQPVSEDGFGHLDLPN